MRRRPTVLLIEENSAVRDALGQALEREDFSVLPATCGRDVTSTERTFDVALIDVSSDCRGGFEFFQRLNETNPFLPVILMGSHPEFLSHPDAAQASARMLKPLEMPLLCSTVRDLTSNQLEGSIRQLVGCK